MNYILYVDSTYHGTYHLTQVLEEARRHLQFGCDIEITQVDSFSVPKLTQAVSNTWVSNKFPNEVTH